MQLAEYKPRWDTLTRTQKLEIIEDSNDRRLQAFEVSKQKKRSGGRSKSTRKRSSRGTPKTAEGFMELLKKMSPEERENMKMALITDTDD